MTGLFSFAFSLLIISVLVNSKDFSKDEMLEDFELTSLCVKEALKNCKEDERKAVNQYSDVLVKEIIRLNSLAAETKKEKELEKEAQNSSSNNQPLPKPARNKTNDVRFPHNCADLYIHGDKESGIRIVYPFGSSSELVFVVCDQSTDGGGWTVFQRRESRPQREDFFKGWEEYQKGFGNFEGEFWLGLEPIHALAKSRPMELRVDLEDFDGGKRWAKYENFFIDDETGKYRLHARQYSGDAGNALENHDGMMFTTKDQDNDDWERGNCAQMRKGAWWYHSCYDSNLNGQALEGWHTFEFAGINWKWFRGLNYSLKATSMKIRPKMLFEMKRNNEN